MRLISRAAVLGTLAAAVAATPAMAATGTLSATVTGKPGTLLLGTPTVMTITAQLPSRPPTQDGNTKLQALVTKLPSSFVFNPAVVKPCPTATFVATGSCPSASKIGSAVLKADGTPDVQGDITANATLYFGTGFTVLAFVDVDKPSRISAKVVGEIRSSSSQDSAGINSAYGLALYIPVTPNLQNPTGALYPTIKSLVATVKPPTKSAKVKGFSGKAKIPLVGLGPGKNLPFAMDFMYQNAAGATVATDTAAGKAKFVK